jgi:hypothetical protein
VSCYYLHQFLRNFQHFAVTGFEYRDNMPIKTQHTITQSTTSEGEVSQVFALQSGKAFFKNCYNNNNNNYNHNLV